MKIITAELDHIPEIISLNKQFKEIFEKTQGESFPITKYESENWIENQIISNSFYTAINKANKVLGAMCLFMNCLGVQGEAYIETLAISPRYHKKGIGKKLVNSAIKISNKNKQEILIVESFCFFNAADFYKKCGFTQESKLEVISGQKFYTFSMDLKN